MKKLFVIVLLLCSGLLGFIVSFFQHKNISSSQAIQTIQVAHYPATFVKQLVGDPEAGRKIFKEFCAACHVAQPLIDIKAPPIGDKKAWEIRRQLGMEKLLEITINGAGAMPARGGCFECSDEQLRETIRYILDQSDVNSNNNRNF